MYRYRFNRYNRLSILEQSVISIVYSKNIGYIDYAFLNNWLYRLLTLEQSIYRLSVLNFSVVLIFGPRTIGITDMRNINNRLYRLSFSNNRFNRYAILLQSGISVICLNNRYNRYSLPKTSAISVIDPWTLDVIDIIGHIACVTVKYNQRI